METLKVSGKSIKLMMAKLSQTNNLLTETQACNLVEGLKKKKTILECAYISSYQNENNAVKILMTDDAAQYNLIAEYSALCWIHEGRHYKKISPIAEINREKLETFIRQFWEYHKTLKTYSDKPEYKFRKTLEEDFDKLFSTKTGFDMLDERIVKTMRNKARIFLYIIMHLN